ncbi:hypothetical protein [Gilvimarinus japonicus]
MLAQDERLAELWGEAKKLTDANNAHAGYDNPSIAAGDFDFSDTVEATWIFNMNDFNNVDDFFQVFATKH